ncbi:MAG: FAD:protein FMN transferase [Opitutaceae bacterium]
MNTTFEMVIDHPDGAYARQAARASFDELDRLETCLSRFVDGGDISRLNRAPAGQSIHLGADAWACLHEAVELHTVTYGAFDVSLGSGLPALVLDPKSSSVRKAADHTDIDLGGIGKGFALDRLVSLLEDWGIRRACLIGGGSSILALDPPEGIAGWPVGLGTGSSSFRITLCQAALGASGTGSLGEHICDPVDPSRMLPTRRTWVCARNATWADALATAFMVLAEDRIDSICHNVEELAALIEHEEPAGIRPSLHGHPPLRNPT